MEKKISFLSYSCLALLCLFLTEMGNCMPFNYTKLKRYAEIKEEEKSEHQKLLFHPYIRKETDNIRWNGEVYDPDSENITFGAPLPDDTPIILTKRKPKNDTVVTVTKEGSENTNEPLGHDLKSLLESKNFTYETVKSKKPTYR